MLYPLTSPLFYSLPHYFTHFSTILLTSPLDYSLPHYFTHFSTILLTSPLFYSLPHYFTHFSTILLTSPLALPFQRADARCPQGDGKATAGGALWRTCGLTDGNEWVFIFFSKEILNFFQRNLFSLMRRFIPTRLRLSYPSSCPWHTEACGEALVMKQLAFASWKAISVPSTKLGTSVYLPSGEPGNNIFLISSLNSQTCLPPPNPVGI